MAPPPLYRLTNLLFVLNDDGGILAWGGMGLFLNHGEYVRLALPRDRAVNKGITPVVPWGLFFVCVAHLALPASVATMKRDRGLSSHARDP